MVRIATLVPLAADTLGRCGAVTVADHRRHCGTDVVLPFQYPAGSLRSRPDGDRAASPSGLAANPFAVHPMEPPWICD